MKKTLMVKHTQRLKKLYTLRGFSDKTCVRNCMWKDLKKEAMKPGFTHPDQFVSTPTLPLYFK